MTVGVIALVGGSGLVGQATARALEATGVRVVIVDRVRPAGAAAFAPCDLTDHSARTTLDDALAAHDVSAVVHLAARVDPPKDAREREAMRRLHDEGTRAVCEAARARGAHVTLVSSAVVYGAWPDNRVPLPTTAPVRPRELPYAVDKALQERVANDVLCDNVAIVRPAIVYAPRAKSYLTEILRRARLPLIGRGVLPALDGHRPPLQFVHADDVAAIIAAVVLRRHRGIVHAASVDWLAYDDVAQEAGLRVLPMPVRLIGPALEALVPLMPPTLRAPRALFPYLMHPFVLDMATTIVDVGVRPRWSSRDALRAMLAGQP